MKDSVVCVDGSCVCVYVYTHTGLGLGDNIASLPHIFTETSSANHAQITLLEDIFAQGLLGVDEKNRRVQALTPEFPRIEVKPASHTTRHRYTLSTQDHSDLLKTQLRELERFSDKAPRRHFRWTLRQDA